MSLKEAIGHALNEAIDENPSADYCDAREVDRLADAVLAVLGWSTFARHTDVVSRKLSDGSVVYDVLLPMIIEGERGEYWVQMTPWGWSSVVPRIYVRETRPVLRWFWRWRCVAAWPSMHVPSLSWNTWYPWDQKTWFQRTVQQYERHQAAWAEHQK